MKAIQIFPHWFLNQILGIQKIHPLVFLCLMFLLFYKSFPLWIYHFDPTAALPDAGIWTLIALSILVYLILLLLSAYLFKLKMKWLGLPTYHTMVSQFNTLTLWQQYVIYWASFALLLLAAIGCLIAIC
ncbi:hypothetical protein [Pedobacter alpinus]|uniref:ABC transporter permease n=1 Tax=Pedobacter alpinus TaxID=1590643 RepID=A0ABW5TPA4_9SPHI